MTEQLFYLKANLQRRVVNGQDKALISAQFWYDEVGKTILWDLDLMFQTLRHKCDKMQKLCHWLNEFKKRAATDLAIIDGIPWQLSCHPAPDYNLHSIQSSSV